MTFPLYCTANGKAVLAELTDAEIHELLARCLPAFTPATITKRSALLTELAGVRETGVAFDREEHTAGISAAVVALREPHMPAFAISVPMPTSRFQGRERDIVRAITRTRRELIATLGPGQRRTASALTPCTGHHPRRCAVAPHADELQGAQQAGHAPGLADHHGTI